MEIRALLRFMFSKVSKRADRYLNHTPLIRPTRLLISEKFSTYTIKWSYLIIWQVQVIFTVHILKTIKNLYWV